MQTVSLAGPLSLRDAPALAAQLASALGEGDVVVEVASLEAVDISIVQVLLAGLRTATDEGRRFGLAQTDHPVLHTALQQLGLLGDNGAADTPEHRLWTHPITLSASEES